MKVLVIVSAFLLVQVYGNVITAKCDSQRFTTCTDTFAKALGLPSMPTDATVLDRQIKTLEAKGRQGQVQVCKAAEKLQTCLDDEYNDCLSVAYLKSIGESDEDARLFVSISKQLETTCAQVQAVEIDEKCDSQRFDTCTEKFAKALGLPSMPTDADVLNKQIKSIEAKGKQGQIQVCKADKELQRCLGHQYHACISVEYLKSIGESDKDAKEFVQISRQVEKQCEQITMVDDAKCDDQLFTRCTNAFAKALNLPSMPKDADVLDKQIKSIEAKGKQGKVQVCEANKELQECLGRQYRECISVEYLKSIGESEKDAKKFVMISHALKEKCERISMIDAKCEDQRFTKCTDEFAKALGLPTMPTDSDFLNKQIKTLEAKGKQGQIQVCKAAEHLQGCLGQEYDACISVDYLKSIGESDKDATEFVQIAKQLEKTCVQINFNEDKCDQVTFLFCTNMFALALDLPAIPQDPNVLDQQIKKLEAKGKSGKTQVCNAGANLQACLANQFTVCISVDYLKSRGASDADAKKFVAISNQTIKTCTQTLFNVGNDKCEKQRFDQCTDKFAKTLGLPSMPTDSRVLLLQIMTVEAKGQQGAKQVCQATNDLQSCLGQQYDDCLSVAFLKSIGESDADAQAFVKVSDLLKNGCVH